MGLRGRVVILILGVFLFLAKTQAFGQLASAEGSVNYQRSDGTMVPVRGASVDIHRIDLVPAQFKNDIHLTTGADGKWVTFLSFIGTYTFSIKAPGAAPFTSSPLRAGREIKLDVVLKPLANVTRNPAEPSLSKAKFYDLANAGLRLPIPVGWTAVTTKHGEFILYCEKGAIQISFFIEPDYKQMVLGLKQGLRRKLSNFQIVEAEVAYKHKSGLLGTREIGTGRLKGVNMRWNIGVLQARRPVVMFQFAIASVRTQHVNEILQMYDGIQALR